MSWTPLGQDPESHHALVDGTPPWMDSALRGHFENELPTTLTRDSRSLSARKRSYERATMLELALRLDSVVRNLARGGESIYNNLSSDERVMVLDWFVKDNAELRSERKYLNAQLELILHSGGSKWKVGTRAGHPGLEERVPKGVQTAADEVIAQSGDAGVLLSEAWHAAFGRNPDPEDAYEKAIKAVEHAGASKVAPNSDIVTLGTMIRDIKNQSTWRLPLESDYSDVPLAMTQALWKSQQSRHGGKDYRKPTPEQAEAAVLLAVPLVQWFIRGTFVRR